MTTQQRRMIKRAQEMHPGTRIEPCGVHEKFEDCFTEGPGRDGNTKIMFWFNAGKSSHLVYERKE